ncbi:MAG: hypothetical protein KBD01_13655 [Acidobacteria bacterium]|nr:hypothetical protein [Acidobacteriota bacterium]
MTPGDLGKLDDDAMAVRATLAALPGLDLPQEADRALRARCRAALAASESRRTFAAPWWTIYTRVLEPAMVAILSVAVLAATLIRAVAILAGRVT